MDKNRIAQAHNPLSPRLVFRQLTGREEVSRLFEWQLELLAENNANVKPEDLLGRDITIELQTQTKGSRFLNGQVTRFAFVGKEVAEDTDLWRYEARLSPWLWYLTRESDCRIFQNKTVPDILDKIFDKYPFPVEKRLTGSYRQWEYCVQYQETDFNFVSRLMEEEGIFYYFEHAMGRHTLVLCDDVSVLTPCPDGYGSIPYIPHDRVVIADEECVDDVRSWQQVESGGYTADDYDFEKPAAELLKRRTQPAQHPHGDHAQYHWPGGYIDPGDGENYARVHLEEIQMPKETVLFQTNARGVAAGRLFTLKSCPRKDLNREYMIVATSFYIRDNPYHTGGEGGGSQWRFGVTAQPTSLPYRPLRITPKPLTSGPQTAVVVGPSGEEIHTDKYGRVRVLFHWDQRSEQGDRGSWPFVEDASCWMRVSQPWAGTKYGAVFLPRVGQEVIVDFIGGDPDQPIVTGRVHNADQMPPWDLPRFKTQSGILTRSTKKGAQLDANMIRFEDQKGQEEIHIHAQRNLVTVVEKDEFRRVEGHRDVHIVGHHVERVEGNVEILIDGSEDVHVGGAKKETVDGAADVHVKGAFRGKADGATSLTSGGSLQAKGGSKIAVEAGTEIHLKGGMKVIIEGGMQVSLKGPGGFIDIGPAGVTIQGTMVKINSGGAAGSGSGSSPDSPSDAKKASPADPSPERP